MQRSAEYVVSPKVTVRAVDRRLTALGDIVKAWIQRDFRKSSGWKEKEWNCGRVCLHSAGALIRVSVSLRDGRILGYSALDVTRAR